MKESKEAHALKLALTNLLVAAVQVENALSAAQEQSEPGENEKKEPAARYSSQNVAIAELSEAVAEFEAAARAADAARARFRNFLRRFTENDMWE